MAAGVVAGEPTRAALIGGDDTAGGIFGDAGTAIVGGLAEVATELGDGLRAGVGESILGLAATCGDGGTGGTTT